MEEKIKEKLKEILSKDIDNEEKMVYMFVLIRKLLELSGSNRYKSYRILNFFCNWMLHSKIEYIFPIRESLEEFKKAFEDKKPEKIFEFINQDKLKKQLEEFLKVFDIKYILNWKKFVTLLGKTLMDFPLEGRIDPIKSFTFKEASNGGIKFIIEFPDGRKVETQWNSTGNSETFLAKIVPEK